VDVDNLCHYRSVFDPANQSIVVALSRLEHSRTRARELMLMSLYRFHRPSFPRLVRAFGGRAPQTPAAQNEILTVYF
jgi:hypothetical protein